jgi:hypothetical protein
MSLQQQQQYWSGRGKLADDACEIAASNAEYVIPSFVPFHLQHLNLDLVKL